MHQLQHQNRGMVFDIGDVDSDGDGVSDDDDNCRDAPTPTRPTLDGDGAGDACDADDDGDGRMTPPTTARSIRTRIRRTPTATAWAMPAMPTMPTSTTTACRTTSTAASRRRPVPVVNAEGCAIAQICPCDKKWKNHVAYVACVARTGNDFREDGLISAKELVKIVLQAGKSRCGARSGN